MAECADADGDIGENDEYQSLAEAQQILKDKARSKAAKSAAMNLAKDLESSATNMKLAAGGKLKK